MARLQATWTPEGRLFLWSTAGDVVDVAAHEIPGLVRHAVSASRRQLAMPGDTRRRRTDGVEAEPSALLSPLSTLPLHASVSDSVRCWAAATKLGLELASRRRVVPTVREGRARWKVLLTRPKDRERFEDVVAALPPVGRAIPVDESRRGPVRLYTSRHAVRSYLDALVDGIYRREAYPGPARGWALELAQALRGAEDVFSPRDARWQAIPERIATWSAGADEPGLQVGLHLVLPNEAARDRFVLELRLHPAGAPETSVPLRDAWQAGSHVRIAGQDHPHPHEAALRGLARAVRLYPPMVACLEGEAPRDLDWNAHETWRFLSEGRPALEAGGLEVALPDSFEGAGKQRIRARMRLELFEQDGRIDLSDLLRFRWEVVLGDMVLSGNDFAELLAERQPIVRFRGEWVLLDPRELDRLPEDLTTAGTLPAAEALRAVLVGEHQGVPVVADEKLTLLLEALRHPPDQPTPPRLQATLRPYQERGFAWLTTLGALGLGACLADDMGLGKTLQLIAHLVRRRDDSRLSSLPSLVVCPTSVLGNWERELRRFAPHLRVMRHHGQSRGREPFDEVDVVLTTYGLLVRDAELLADEDWDVVALDEAQSIKNPDSQRARSARELTARHRVALTGTPIENRLEELWSLMEFLVPRLLGPRGAFRRNVAVPVERFGDEEVARKLRLGVAPFLLRRLKSDPNVIDDLPDKIERNEYTPLTREQATLYRDVMERHLEEIAESSDIERRGRVLAMLTALKQVCNHPVHYLQHREETADRLEGRSGKLDRLTDLLEVVVDNGERALIFTQYKEMGKLLQRHLQDLLDDEIPFLHGGTPPKQRDAMVRAFQESDDAAPVLVVSLRAGGTGLNLTRASHVVHYDRWWNPAVEDQATDRAYRIGQRSNVQVHKLVTQGTLEERIDALLEQKRELADAVVGSGEGWVTELDDDALRQLVMLGDDAVLEGQ